jgi:hypothetical protein
MTTDPQHVTRGIDHRTEMEREAALERVRDSQQTLAGLQRQLEAGQAGVLAVEAKRVLAAVTEVLKHCTTVDALHEAGTYLRGDQRFSRVQ